MISSRPFTLVVLVALCLMTALTEAQPQRGFPFAARQKAVGTVTELTDQSGPWLVMCASFVGETADLDAEELAAELQKQGLKTYLYRKSFDFSVPVEGVFNSSNPEEVEVRPDGQLIPKKQRMKVAKSDALPEVAVLVGDFPTIDDHRAQQTLAMLKIAPVQLSGSAAHMAMLESTRSSNLAPRNGGADKGALAAAFLMTNPLLPDEYFSANQVDREMISLNEDFRHSLLKNPGVYSVRIATFRGEQTFRPNDIVEEEKKFFGLLQRKESAKSGKLAEAGLKASVLTKVLREEGIEAWEFHDRFESYVCVGSFDWISRENSLGLEENNPELVATIEQYRGQTTNALGQSNLMQPKAHKKLASRGITYDVQPLPVMVPRQTANTRNARR